MAKAKKTKSVKIPIRIWVVTHRRGDEIDAALFRKEKDAVENFDYAVAGVLGSEVTDGEVADAIKQAHEYDEYWYNEDQYDGEITLRTEFLY